MILLLQMASASNYLEFLPSFLPLSRSGDTILYTYFAVSNRFAYFMQCFLLNYLAYLFYWKINFVDKVH